MSRALLFLILLTSPAVADEIRVAVASNFAGAAKAIAQSFEEATSHRPVVITASTGKLYAQIRAGAPFDVFLAADVERPTRLVDDRHATEQRVYAIGRLVLVSADRSLAGRNCRTAFLEAMTPWLAIANPETAPYGRVAQDWLDAVGVMPRVVRGENVGQAMSFVATGNAQFGLVAWSQWLSRQADWPGCAEEIDAAAGVQQSAALLTRGSDNPAAIAFYEFLFSATAQAEIEALGYRLPAAH